MARVKRDDMRRVEATAWEGRRSMERVKAWGRESKGEYGADERWGMR